MPFFLTQVESLQLKEPIHELPSKSLCRIVFVLRNLLHRLVFVTSSTGNAASSEIGNYNAIVQAAADASPLAALGQSWKAIASTETVSARDNTGTALPGVNDYPIYLVSGELVASSNSDLWDGSIGHVISTTESGSPTLANFVWTGSNPDGTAYHSDPDQIGPLGVQLTTVGLPSASDNGWVLFGTGVLSAHPDNSFPYYAMSGPLTAVPEPASYVLSIIGGASLLGIRALRRRSHASRP